MLQWVTFTLAALSAALWLVVFIVGGRMLVAYRHQVAAARSMAKAMGAARPPRPSSERAPLR